MHPREEWRRLPRHRLKEAHILKVNSKPDLKKSSEYVTLADAEAINKELKAAASIHKRLKFTLNIPSCMRAEVGKYALCYGPQADRKRFSRKYPQYEFKPSTVNNWNKKITKDPKSREDQFIKVGRTNKVNDKVMLKIKEVIVGIRLARAVTWLYQAVCKLVTCKLFISVRTRVLKANNPNSLSEFGGNVILTDMWARGVLKSMDWVKRKGTTGKVEPLKQF